MSGDELHRLQAWSNWWRLSLLIDKLDLLNFKPLEIEFSKGFFVDEAYINLDRISKVNRLNPWYK